MWDKYKKRSRAKTLEGLKAARAAAQTAHLETVALALQGNQFVASPREHA